MVIWLAERLLASGARVGILSRGIGGTVAPADFWSLTAAASSPRPRKPEMNRI
jgi:tetraacyldisaccharide-1-P 4'-kinase